MYIVLNYIGRAVLYFMEDIFSHCVKNLPMSLRFDVIKCLRKSSSFYYMKMKIYNKGSKMRVPDLGHVSVDGRIFLLF